jgi:2-polyprenyl-6-methoxyphenol hydroxylase-like FAD-dependent oxidoreductase
MTVRLNKVLVVGGGIAGLSVAIGLDDKGYDVEVVEKNASWSVYHVGIVVQANFLRALDAIGLGQNAAAAGYAYNGVRFVDMAGNYVEELPGKPAADGLPGNLGLTRPALHHVLQTRVAEMGIPVRTGVTFTDMKDTGEAVEVTFSDNTRGTYDLVIGADGNYSAVRKAIFPEAPAPAYTGQGVWRYNLPRPADLNWGHVWLGKDGGKAGYIPLSADTMYVWAVFGEPGNPYFPPETLADQMRKRLEGYGGQMAVFRDQITDPAQVVYRPLEAIIMPDPWYRGRVMLIGDAAHSATPHLGQGAAMAVEDAVVLVDELDKGETLQGALAGTMQRRFDRARYIGLSSIQLGKWEMEGADAGDPVALHAQVRQRLAEPI